MVKKKMAQGKYFATTREQRSLNLTQFIQRPPPCPNGLNILTLTSLNHLIFWLHSAATSPRLKELTKRLSAPLFLPSADMFLN